MAKRVLAVDEIMDILRTTVPRLDALTEASRRRGSTPPESRTPGRSTTCSRILPPDGWERVARVTEGPGEERDRTAQFYGDWMAAHEREHLEQIARIVADLADT